MHFLKYQVFISMRTRGSSKQSRPSYGSACQARISLNNSKLRIREAVTDRRRSNAALLWSDALCRLYNVMTLLPFDIVSAGTRLQCDFQVKKMSDANVPSTRGACDVYLVYSDPTTRAYSAPTPSRSHADTKSFSSV